MLEVNLNNQIEENEKLDNYISIDFANYIISVDPKACPLRTVELYSYIHELFDDPEYMRYSVPMAARTPPIEIVMINGWRLSADNYMAYLCLDVNYKKSGLYTIPGRVLIKKTQTTEYFLPKTMAKQDSYIIHKDTDCSVIEME